jgi:hypothetical protein
MAQVGHSAFAEGTLGSLDKEGMFLQLGEDKVEVFRPQRAENQYVVEENQHEPVQEWSQHIVHESLEGCRGVREPERRNKELKQPLVCPECRLLHVVAVQQNLVVAGA